MLLCADTQREICFFSAAVAAAAAESLRADSKFAHQPVSFQCEVKLSNMSRSGPFEGGVTQQSSICSEAKMKQRSNQHFIFMGGCRPVHPACGTQSSKQLILMFHFTLLYPSVAVKSLVMLVV